MTYRVTHSTGEMESGYPTERFTELLEELASADDEHPDVSVVHESEWSLTVYKSGFLVLENLEFGEPSYLGPADAKQSTLDLMVGIAEGRIEEVRSAPWRPGYPPRSTC